MDLDLKQMVAMVDIIAEEKNLPKETVIDVIQHLNYRIFVLVRFASVFLNKSINMTEFAIFFTRTVFQTATKLIWRKGIELVINIMNIFVSFGHRF